MKFGTWNVRRLYRAGSFTAAGRELARYKLDLVGVQEVRWDKGSTKGRRLQTLCSIIIFLCERNENN